MPLKLMYITNDPEVAIIAEASGVDWIFVDLEINGKQERQGHLDTVISNHTLSDVRNIRPVLRRSELLVRVNPIHNGSSLEIDQVIESGADIVMLPFFKELDEVRTFIRLVGGRAKTCLLVETPEAVKDLDNIVKLHGICYIHIGLNDLHIAYSKKFMFELLADGTVDSLARTVKSAGIPFGFGGVARVGEGTLPAEVIIADHYRLGSEAVILSRGFMNPQVEAASLRESFSREVSRLRDFEQSLETKDSEYFIQNRNRLIKVVKTISGHLNSQESAIRQVKSSKSSHERKWKGLN